MRRSTAKLLFGFAAVLGLVLGVSAGFLADGSPSANSLVLTGLTVWVVCHLLFGLWVRSREQPKAGDRVVLPNLVPVSVAMLLTVLPQLLWPSVEWVHIAGPIAGLVVIGVAGVRLIRRRRQLTRRQS